VRSRRRKDRGAVLLLAAVLILVFIAVAALAVDLGQLHIAKARAQHVCDASALAGAWYLEPSDSALTEQYVRETAQELAITNNQSDNRKVLQTATTGMNAEGVTVTSVLGRSITVEGQVKVNFGFAALLGFDSSRVKASASAMLDDNLGFGYKFLPLAVTDNWVLYGVPDPVPPYNQKLSTPFWDVGTGSLSPQPSNTFPIVLPGDMYSPGDYQAQLKGEGPELALRTGKPARAIGTDVAVLTRDTLKDRLPGVPQTWDAWNNASDEQKAASPQIVVLPIVRQDRLSRELSIVGFAGFFIESVSLYSYGIPNGSTWHRVDIRGRFVPGIVGSKTVRWLKPFQPDTANLMYRVRLTK